MAVKYVRLWKLLLDKGMKRTDLISAAGISSNILAKLGKDEFVSMESLDKICNALGCDISEIVEFTKWDDQDYSEAKEFARLKSEPEKVELAISRLENPYHIADEDRVMYQNYLAKSKPQVVRGFVDQGRTALFPYLVKYRTIKKSNVTELAEYAQQAKKLDILSYLLNVSNDFRTRPREMGVAKKFVPGQGVEEQQRFPRYDSLQKGELVWLGKAPMPWVVLKKKDKRVLLISKYAFDCRPYHHTYHKVDWSLCSLRKWLNTEFLERTFSPEEQKLFCQVTIDEEDALHFTDSSAGDSLFLLSTTEASRYFESDEARRARMTEHALKKIMWTTFNEYGHWWLRTPSVRGTGAAYVRADGKVLDHGGVIISNSFDAFYEHYGVRPALYLNLD